MAPSHRFANVSPYPHVLQASLLARDPSLQDPNPRLLRLAHGCWLLDNSGSGKRSQCSSKGGKGREANRARARRSGSASGGTGTGRESVEVSSTLVSSANKSWFRDHEGS
jgi:hypothetical protein